MIKFARIGAGKENDKLELLRVSALNGGVVNAMQRVEKGASYLADIMAGLHGGQWQVQIDHQSEFVIIRKHSPGARS